MTHQSLIQIQEVEKRKSLRWAKVSAFFLVAAIIWTGVVIVLTFPGAGHRPPKPNFIGPLSMSALSFGSAIASVALSFPVCWSKRRVFWWALPGLILLFLLLSAATMGLVFWAA